MTREQLTEKASEFFNECLETLKKKNDDYTGRDADDALKNFKSVEAVGIRTGDGFITRMMDKISRVSGIVRNKEYSVKDESARDTLMDLANYSFLLSAFLSEDQEPDQGWIKAQKVGPLCKSRNPRFDVKLVGAPAQDFMKPSTKKIINNTPDFSKNPSFKEMCECLGMDQKVFTTKDEIEGCPNGVYIIELDTPNDMNVREDVVKVFYDAKTLGRIARFLTSNKLKALKELPVVSLKKVPLSDYGR